jgi:hypothetical protein
LEVIQNLLILKKDLMIKKEGKRSALFLFLILGVDFIETKSFRNNKKI